MNRPPQPSSLAAGAAANLALSFILELGALFAIGYWGIHTGQTPLLKILLGLFVPVLVAILWGIFAAPKAPQRLSGIALWIFELAVFGLAIAALAFAGQSTLAWIFLVVLLINRILMVIWKQ